MPTPPVQFGLSLPNRAVLFGVSPQLLLQAAVLAEELGCFDSVWVGDNFLSKPRLEAIVTLSAVASRTSRVKLGTVCLASFPMRHPLLLALQWASLDQLSDGRTILAVCIGGSANSGPRYAAELAATGVANNERVPRTEEGIELLRRLWAAEPLTFDGRFYHMKDVEALPKPAQPRVPIVLAANPSQSATAELTERILRRVARLADGWQTDAVPPAVFGERWNRIREYAAEYGRADQVNHASLHLMVNINDDVRAARDEAVRFLDRYYGVGAIGGQFLDDWLAIGPPEAVAEKIAAFTQAGCTTPILRFASPDQLGQIQRCAAEVLPLFDTARPLALASAQG
jgi:alkanesulfonate monooxygenase SsuD/methylene tetrahydromethanopterin reductase-like flavin-dependent oxidoreductase (luciferase family)